MNLAITCESDFWNENTINEIADECVRNVFNEFKLNPDEEDIEICFLFTTDDEIQLINRTYRGIDKATNVLSFPAFAPDDIPLGKESSCHCHEHCECEDDHCECDTECECECCDDEPCVLGSIAVAYETTAREAEEQGKTFGDHLRHLIIHSLLHLLGYDHIDSEEAKRMEDKEIKILKKMGISDPYQ